MAKARRDRIAISIFPCGHQAIIAGVFQGCFGPLSRLCQGSANGGPAAFSGAQLARAEAQESIMEWT